MRNTRRNLWKIVKFTVLVDCYSITRVLEIFFTINQLVVRYNGMHKHSIPLYNVTHFTLEFSGEEIKVKVNIRET
jgi:hypothetical protein